MTFFSVPQPNTKPLPPSKSGIVSFHLGVVLLVMFQSDIMPCGFSRSSTTVMFPKSKLIGLAFMPEQDSIKTKTKKLKIAEPFMILLI